MPVYIHNSLTRKKEEFLPLKSPLVNIYTCGVTVYDDSHIGHGRSLYTFDVIRRYLKYRGFKVRFVRNITDIDDKIINRAKELNTDWQELVKKYIARYYEDLEGLGIAKADCEPRATENIPDMVNYIWRLIEKGFAYEAGGDVYFEVRKFPGYGKLSGQSIDEMRAGSRVEPAELKKDPLDFALWKKSKEGEPSWESPWGKGRPGWHIECSVMAQKFLKTQTLDIHAGGRDLIFPHHENEITQSEAATGKPFAKYWIHHGLLTINGQKMAKSLGNFVTIKDFLSQYEDATILKLFFLSTHYAHPIDYTEEKIQEAKKQKIILEDFFDKVNNWSIHKSFLWRLFRKLFSAGLTAIDRAKIDTICTKFEKAMDGDFNMPVALSCLFELLDLGSEFISADKDKAFTYLKLKVVKFLEIFGIPIPPKRQIRRAKRKQLREMERARRAKGFEKSDRIRKELESEGYIVNNTASSCTVTIDTTRWNLPRLRKTDSS